MNMDTEWRIVAALIVSYGFIIWAAIKFLWIFNSWMKRRREPAVKKVKPLKGQALLDALEKDGAVEKVPGKHGVYRSLPGKDFNSLQSTAPKVAAAPRG
jgi:hypothetical protein